MYDMNVTLRNGSKATLLTRQRPQLVFSDDDKKRPLFLFNGASFEGNNPDLSMLTHTMAFAFETSRSELGLELQSLI